MTIKILGTGCPNCKRLETNTKKALKHLNLKAVIEKVEAIEEIISYGIMSTPALVVDEEIKLTGKVPSPAEIEKYLV